MCVFEVIFHIQGRISPRETLKTGEHLADILS